MLRQAIKKLRWGEREVGCRIGEILKAKMICCGY